jgi:sigma-54 specific flagellar transcriptional regulator A
VHRLSCFFPNQKVSLSQVPANLLPSDIARFGAMSGHGFIGGGPVQNELELSLYVPEAENPVEDAIMRAQGSAVATVSASTSFPEDGVHLKDHMAEIERNLILKALEESNGNVSQSARLLNLQRTTLIEKINKYKLA